MKTRYELRAEFRSPLGAALEWHAIDTHTGQIIAKVYAFNGTAQAIVDLLNQGPRDAKDECDKLKGQLVSRIQNYLGNGGLFNPEMMEHDKVRDLLMLCRDYLNQAKP